MQVINQEHGWCPQHFINTLSIIPADIDIIQMLLFRFQTVTKGLLSGLDED